MVAPLLEELQGERSRISEGFDPEDFRDEQRGAIGEMLSGKPSFDLDPEVTTAAFEKGVAAPLLRQFEETKAEIGAGFAGLGGSFSTRKMDVQGKALEGLHTQMAAKLAEMQFKNQAIQAQLAESAKQRQVQGVGAAEQFAISPLSRSGAFQAALDPYQRHAQQQATAGFQDFMRTAPEANPFVGRAMGWKPTETFDTVLTPESSWMGAGPGSLIGAGLGALVSGGNPIGAQIGAGAGGWLGGMF